MEWKPSRREFVIASGLSIAGLFLPKGVSADNPPDQAEPEPSLPEFSSNLLILTYHTNLNSDLLINDYQYCKQHGWQPIGFEDLAEFVLRKTPLPSSCFLPTFDDGFIDQKPAILGAREYIKSRMGEEYRAVIFALTQYEHPNQPVEDLPETTLTYREKDPADFQPGEKPRHLTIGDTIEILQKCNGFVRVENHTMDHANLITLSEAERLPQIYEGKKRTDILYQRAGMERKYSALAYPFWGNNEQIRQEVAAAGYTMAFGAMLDDKKQKIMEPVIQTPQMRFYLQRMSRT